MRGCDQKLLTVRFLFETLPRGVAAFGNVVLGTTVVGVLTSVEGVVVSFCGCVFSVLKISRFVLIGLSTDL